MAVSLKTHKILWARSGGKCAICKNDLVIDPTDLNDDPSIVGDEAHIIARSDSFTRGDYESLSANERDHYSNLILLCKTHHKQVDDQPGEYTVEKLRQIKEEHEAAVKEHWNADERKKQSDELVYAGYIDEWEQRANLNAWRDLSTWLSADGPGLLKAWYDDQKELLIWMMGRIWPSRHPLLESSLHNYEAVLCDLLNTFDLHIDYKRKSDHVVYTKKFYKIDEWNPQLYAKLLTEYNEHVNLVDDLFYELTRAANYVCDRVREMIFEGYRIKEGVLLVERRYVGFEMRTVIVRPEYKGEERTDMPYPGLEEL